MSGVMRPVLFAAWVGLGTLFLLTVRVDTAQSRGNTSSPKTDTSRHLSMFAPSTDCVACHNNLVTPGGEDVSIGASWRSTMMANSARDPYVQASVRRETIDHAGRADDIEDECATCHLPAAHKIAHAAGGKATIFAHVANAAVGARTPLDELAIDGVSCTVCHQIAADRLGTRSSFNGNFVVAPPRPDGRRRAFGPFDVDAGRRRLMHSVTHFEQEKAPHIRESEVCATCHTLITEAIGPDGGVIGSLPEQMNYQEWRHSSLFQEGRSCQSCHMPPAQGPVRIASVLGDDRERLARHTFVGGNAFMLRLMNRYRLELGMEATSAELEATARATVRQLEQDTATVTVEAAAVRNGVLSVDVTVRNLTGHKFPTGYPSRRAWLHVTVRDLQGRTVFESGRVAETGSIAGNDSDAGAGTFEPHYDQITRSDEVQIYESIMGTPAGAPTTGLLQATRYLKDNRLLPRGFDKRTAAPEIAVFGAAATDPDFSGDGDRVHYRIPMTGSATVEVELRYQPIGYRWAQNLAPYDAHEPRRFVGYYNDLAPFSSIVVARTSRTLGP
jgi:hypothetical protein